MLIGLDVAFGKGGSPLFKISLAGVNTGGHEGGVPPGDALGIAKSRMIDCHRCFLSSAALTCTHVNIIMRKYHYTPSPKHTAQMTFFLSFIHSIYVI